MIHLLLSNRLYTVCLIFMFHLMAIPVCAQIPITGKVVDERNEALIGASVLEKGTGTGTVTDMDGNYSLTVSGKDSKLVFSYLGYVSKEVTVRDKRVHNIQLESDANVLDELVVMGYGTQKKMSVTGAVSHIDAAELQKAPTSNLSAMLQGRLPGLVAKQDNGQPGRDGASLYVRGVGSGDGNILVVVDGIVRPFPAISPEEVESITILKDAASASVYGFNGSAGVILITTKRGKEQKPTIHIDSSISLSTNTNFPTFLNGKNYMYWYNKAQELDGVPQNSLRFTQDEIDRVTYGDPYGVYTNTDWFDLVFKSSAPTYTNNISLSGGDSRFKYYVGLGSYNQEGVLKNTSYDRYNIRTNIDAQVTRNFSVSLGMGIRHSKVEEPPFSAGSIMSQAMLSYPYLPATTYSGMPVGSLNSAGNGNQNPVALRDLSGIVRNREKRMETNITLKYDIPGVDGLSVKFTASYDYFHRMVKKELTPYKLAVYNQTTKTWSEAWGRAVSGGETIVS